MQFTIRSNARQFLKRMKNHQKQVRYATSRAINDTTKEAREATIKQAKHSQRSKKAWWFNKAYGIRRQFASKRMLRGAVFTKIHWARLQEKGGIKRPKGRHIVVPDPPFPKGQRKAGGLSKVLKQRTVFKNKDAIYRRVGGKRSRKVKRLASLVDHARIDKPILKFRQTAHKVVRRRFRQHLDKWLSIAFKTSR